MWLVFLLVLVLSAYGFYEYSRHSNNINQISNRIHINGTRGKSSVTRLVGGGLKGGGKQVFIKTTGTSPRIIDVDGKEYPIRRVGSANIIEQLKIARQAVADKAEYFVVECMALFPGLQYITEHQMIRSQVGAITNIREDHLDVMGPRIEDVAQAICNTIPRNGMLFTTENRFIETINKRASVLNTEVISVDPETVTVDDLAGFSYLEHKDNVALALAICEHYNIDRQSALKGMHQIKPDSGAMHKYSINIHGKTIEFVNAFAANDPDSYRAIWKMFEFHKGNKNQFIVLVNSRQDRIQRAEQLGEFIAREVEADYFVVSGEYTYPLVQKAIKSGLSPEIIKDMGGQSADKVFNYICDFTDKSSLVVGIGNIVGLGDEIVKYFINKGRIVA
ncbi:MAG: poly-gamma-glutamate synthase PgsB [candidate division Zixibacteria bacterium]|nr:poly-gamma-glutamate synthase PgsB [candidate division Zixibacteria bacterium]